MVAAKGVEYHLDHLAGASAATSKLLDALDCYRKALAEPASRGWLCMLAGNAASFDLRLLTAMASGEQGASGLVLRCCCPSQIWAEAIASGLRMFGERAAEQVRRRLMDQRARATAK